MIMTIPIKFGLLMHHFFGTSCIVTMKFVRKVFLLFLLLISLYLSYLLGMAICRM